MKIQRSLSILFATVVMILASGINNAEETLTPVEDEDRFVYRYDLLMRNLELAVKESKIVIPGLPTHFTNSESLALLTLDRSKSKEAYRGLAFLSLVVMDGSVSRDHSCAVLKKGKAILPFLEEARRAAINGKCVIEAEVVWVKMKPGLCRTKDEANKKIERFIQSISEGHVC